MGWWEDDVNSPELLHSLGVLERRGEKQTLLEILHFAREKCQELKLLANLPGVMPGKPLANCNFKSDEMPGANPTQIAGAPGKLQAGKFKFKLK